MLGWPSGSTVARFMAVGSMICGLREACWNQRSNWRRGSSRRSVFILVCRKVFLHERG